MLQDGPGLTTKGFDDKEMSFGVKKSQTIQNEWVLVNLSQSCHVTC
jgi:hypothetical protein